MRKEKDYAGLYRASNFLLSPFFFLLFIKITTFAQINKNKFNIYGTETIYT